MIATALPTFFPEIQPSGAYRMATIRAPSGATELLALNDQRRGAVTVTRWAPQENATRWTKSLDADRDRESGELCSCPDRDGDGYEDWVLVYAARSARARRDLCRFESSIGAPSLAG